MKIVCISVGKKHDSLSAPMIEEYEKRLKHYCNFEWLLIPSSGKEDESKAIIEKLATQDKVILLDETGEQIYNAKLAKLIENAQNSSVDRLVLIIGGAYGVDDTVKERADSVIGLSNLVFPHQLVRAIVVEQIYRSFSILSGSKYHHQ